MTEATRHAPAAPALQRRHPGRRLGRERDASTPARGTCRAPGCAWSRCSRSPRETEISLELVLTFGDDGMSEPLQLLGRVAWCTALFGAYQIGVKFVKIDDERARYLDMFVGFLDGTLAPGGPLGPEDDVRAARAPIPTTRSRSRSSCNTHHKPDIEPPPTRTSRPAHVGRGPHRADRVHRDHPRSLRGGRRSQRRAAARARARRSRSACSWSLDDVESDTPPLWVKARVAWAQRDRRQRLRRRRPLRGDHRRPAGLAAPGPARQHQPGAPTTLTPAPLSRRRGSAPRRARRRARR